MGGNYEAFQKNFWSLYDRIWNRCNACFIASRSWVGFWNRNYTFYSRIYLALQIKRRGIMKIVVYKPGNFMKGILRALFKVKKQDNT